MGKLDKKGDEIQKGDYITRTDETIKATKTILEALNNKSKTKMMQLEEIYKVVEVEGNKIRFERIGESDGEASLFAFRKVTEPEIKKHKLRKMFNG